MPLSVKVMVVLAVALGGLGFMLLVGTLVRRRAPAFAGPSGVRVIHDGAPVEPGPPPPEVAAPVLDSPETGLNRRRFLTRAWLLSMTVVGAAFGAGSLAFLNPNKISGFGSIINAGRRQEIAQFIATQKRPFYSTEGRFYIVTYRVSDPDNPYIKDGLVQEGLMALYQKCAHLGCRVPFCETSQWFECPCHGSRYNFAGEVQAGSPAPTGLWRFPMTIDGDSILVDTSKPMSNPAQGIDTLREPPAGPHCV